MKIIQISTRTAIAVFFFAIPFQSNAQPGISELYQVSAEVRGWYFSLSDLVLAIGAISGLVGGLRVYANWQSGKDHHIDSQVMGWFFSCLFLSIVATSLRALYGI